MKDYRAKFEEKLKRESGISDLEIDWDTYHKTAPVYFRSGDPSVCSSFATTTSVPTCLLSGSRCARSITGQLMIQTVQTGKRLRIQTTGRNSNSSTEERMRKSKNPV